MRLFSYQKYTHEVYNFDLDKSSKFYIFFQYSFKAQFYNHVKIINLLCVTSFKNKYSR